MHVLESTQFILEIAKEFSVHLTSMSVETLPISLSSPSPPYPLHCWILMIIHPQPSTEVSAIIDFFFFNENNGHGDWWMRLLLCNWCNWSAALLSSYLFTACQGLSGLHESGDWTGALFGYNVCDAFSSSIRWISVVTRSPSPSRTWL